MYRSKYTIEDFVLDPEFRKWVLSEVALGIILYLQNWWTLDNPSNEWIMNDVDALRMAGVSTGIYENASFVRLKDITISYDLPFDLIQRVGGNRFRVNATPQDERASNFAIRKWFNLKDEEDNAPFAADRLPPGYAYGDRIKLNWSEPLHNQ